MDKAEDIELFGWCAAATSILLFLAPLPTFRRIVREQRVGHFDSLPYLVSLLQCLLWLSYCMVTPAKIELLISCSTGICVQCLWCILFLRYSFQSGRAAISFRLAFILVAWIAATVLDILLVPHLKFSPMKRGESLQSEAIGLLASFMNILMLGSPLGILKHVVKTQSVEYMPFALSAMVCVTCSFWVAFAVLTGDEWVFVPNALGLLLGIAQLVVYAIYYCRSAKARDRRNADTLAHPLTPREENAVGSCGIV